MKIVDIKVTPPIVIPLKQPLTDAINTIPSFSFAAVQVFTDEGITGVSPIDGSDLSKVLVEKELKPVLVGEDPWNVERIWDKMYWQTFNYGRKGAAINALSKVDIAIWDILGKEVGKPLYKLLGGYRDRVLAYGSGINLSLTLEELVKEQVGFVKRGFKFVKMKVGRRNHEEDVARVKAVRDAVGNDVGLMVDANNGWSVSTAIRMAKKLEKYDIYWLEEPVLAEDVEGLVEVAASTSIPIAAGESEYTKYGFRELIERKAISIVQADVGKVGGITEWRKIAAIANAWNLPMAPHAVTPVSAHLVASVPNGFIVEVFDFDLGGFDYFRGTPQAKDGYLELPNKPGLGLEINVEDVEKRGSKPVVAKLRITSPPYLW